MHLGKFIVTDTVINTEAVWSSWRHHVF